MKTSTLFIILSIFVSNWAFAGSVGIQRTLRNLYQIVNNPEAQKVESQDLILKDYNLIVNSATWWSGSPQAEALWENLAQSLKKELNVIVVYDAPKQDLSKIKEKSPASVSYEFFDQNREFYYWFSRPTLMSAVLIGPDGKILFEGLLNSTQSIDQIKSLVKKKD